MYQLKLNFNLENQVLPRELDSLLVSFLKSSVQQYSMSMFEELYNKSKSIMKTYTFSYYLPGAKFTKNNIQLNQNGFVLFFSDSNLANLIHFLNAFKLMQFKQYPMNGNSMTLKNISTQRLQEINDSEIVVKMQSTLIVRKHDSATNHDIYYTYEQDGFEDALKSNISLFLQRMEIPISADDFSITTVKGKKVIASVFGRNVDTSLGIFKLAGNPELLNLLYLSGLGVRRSEGHGKFELLW